MDSFDDFLEAQYRRVSAWVPVMRKKRVRPVTGVVANSGEVNAANHGRTFEDMELVESRGLCPTHAMGPRLW